MTAAEPLDDAPIARILPTMTSAEYHRDPCAVPSLTSSTATTLVNKSPLHAWLHHPRLGRVQREATEAMARGTMIHELVLGGGSDIVEILADNFRTKAAQEQRDAALARGAVPVLAKDYEDLRETALEITDTLRADWGIALDGESEVSIEFHEETEDGADVTCRCRMDHLVLAHGDIFDLKTCQSAHERPVTSSVWEHGYDIQRAAYTSALRKLRPEIVGRERFTFLFVEFLPVGSKRRAIVQPVELDARFRELGVRRWRRAVETWARCMESGEWPAYVGKGQVMTVEAPGWALIREGF